MKIAAGEAHRAQIFINALSGSLTTRWVDSMDSTLLAKYEPDAILLKRFTQKYLHGIADQKLRVSLELNYRSNVKLSVPWFPLPERVQLRIALRPEVTSSTILRTRTPSRVLSGGLISISASEERCRGEAHGSHVQPDGFPEAK